MRARIYVNPSCSKCRSALPLLDERQVRADPVRYLDEPPTLAELALDDESGDALLEAIARHPILLERPIFVVGDRAVIARPPERVLEIL